MDVVDNSMSDHRSVGRFKIRQFMQPESFKLLRQVSIFGKYAESLRSRAFSIQYKVNVGNFCRKVRLNLDTSVSE